LLGALIVGAWLFLVIRHLGLWLRYTAAEAAFWHKLGFSSCRPADVSRWFYESRIFTYILWFIVALLALMILNAAMYFYWIHLFHIMQAI